MRPSLNVSLPTTSTTMMRSSSLTKPFDDEVLLEGVESLVHLVKMRASQINGCAYCLDVHSKDARALGETEQRLYVLDAWEEAPFYSERERAALALTDAVTRITEGHVPDAVFERARAHFNEQEMIALVFTLTTINAWNRLAITMHTELGKYQPKARPVPQTA
jgi:AhpD family alkylhydroperoxidase